jgi:diguanylate cyclase (GGDEF)-like protein
MVIPLFVAGFVTYVIFTQLLRLQLAKEQIEEMGRMDFLTRIYNREYFLDVGNREFATAYRYNQSLTAMMIDLDNFKQINDVHGHVVGDQVIQASARIISSLIRQSDIFARFGGDEFVLLSPHSNLEEVEKLAKRIVQSISAKPVSTYLIDVKVTVSIGVAALTPEYNNIDKLINAADQALYRAKQAGRNTFST